MRPIAKKFVVAILAILLVLLALGALPSLLKSGDPYYLTAEVTDETVPDENASALEVANLSERSYPYTLEALENASAQAVNGSTGEGNEQGTTPIGRSSPYWKGPVGFKEAFTHSPFDEISSLRVRYSATMIDDDVALVRWQNQTYRLALTGG